MDVKAQVRHNLTRSAQVMSVKAGTRFRIIISFVCLILCLGLGVSLARADYSAPQQINSTSYDAAMTGWNTHGHMVWAASDGTYTQIYFYDGTSVQQITNTAYNNTVPWLNDNDHIVWLGNSGSTPQVFYYDGTTTHQITNNGYVNERPVISTNDVIAWAAGTGTGSSRNYQIYMYNNGVTTPITNNGLDNSNVNISPTGHIVWQGFNSIHNLYQIYLYDGSGTTQLSNNIYVKGGAPLPRITEIDSVAWQGWDGSDWEIYLYAGGATYQLTNNTYDDTAPRLGKSGKVVWSGYDGSHWQIYLYSAGATSPITSNGYDNYYPFINNGDQIVYWAYNGTGYDVYSYDADGTTQISNSNYSNIYGGLFTVGSTIGWNAFDGSHYEIYAAKRQSSGYSQYAFTYYYTDGSGDKYDGQVVAPTGWLSVGSTIYNQPLEMGDVGLNGYYQITRIYDGASVSMNRLSKIINYYDASTATWYGVNSDAAVIPVGVYVTNRSYSEESGYLVYGAQYTNFNTYTSGNLAGAGAAAAGPGSPGASSQALWTTYWSQLSGTLEEDK
ncbi:MAG: hypothetical protein ACOZFS_10720 [Thermodesulfobacteriota bacterium]